uniref:F-box protein 32 n=1 Tax=Pipistrellus kuhlii TaxID=59472 RepID=A0A7J7VM95_PIPKU|nr:F-box protein 32 [Pipistrellus kuhlii]
MLPTERAVRRHPTALQTLSHSFLEGHRPPMHSQQPRELLRVPLSPGLYQLVQVLNHSPASTSRGLPTEWVLGIQSLDPSFVNSVHVQHWLEASEMESRRGLWRGERQSLAGNLRTWTPR